MAVMGDGIGRLFDFFEDDPGPFYQVLVRLGVIDLSLGLDSDHRHYYERQDYVFHIASHADESSNGGSLARS